jgi:hypothetical protein
MENFLLQRQLSDWGKNTYVNWSVNKVTKAIIFIHGFNGSSLETFGNFNLEFRYRPEYFGYDVYFYGYDSLKIQIPISSNSFYSFLVTIHNNIKEIITNSKANVDRPYNYDEIVIVAHSLGAVVARYALLIGADKNDKWLNICKLILFAPAHKGAKKAISNLYNQLPGFLKYVGPLAEFFVVTINEVMEGSELIKELEIKYRSIMKKKDRQFAIAKKVIWAEYDRIVNCVDFLEDPQAEVFKGRDHTNVCKPTKRFTRPFEVVESILNHS